MGDSFIGIPLQRAVIVIAVLLVFTGCQVAAVKMESTVSVDGIGILSDGFQPVIVEIEMQVVYFSEVSASTLLPIALQTAEIAVCLVFAQYLGIVVVLAALIIMVVSSQHPSEPVVGELIVTLERLVGCFPVLAADVATIVRRTGTVCVVQPLMESLTVDLRRPSSQIIAV